MGSPMDRQKLNWITWAVLASAIVIVALMLGNSLHRTAHITLPSSNPPRDPSAETGIASLSRPENYGRNVTIEYFWNGGSGTQELYTIVREPWTRIDRGLSSGQTRISITNGEKTYIWYGYDDGAAVYSAPAGNISADAEQSIPTYEDILDLPAEDILLADYRALNALNCIYVETARDETGYSLRYWISVDSGLLVQAEKLLEESVVYRMSAPYLDQTEYDASRFTLPDGTVLLDDISAEPMEPIS